MISFEINLFFLVFRLILLIERFSFNDLMIFIEHISKVKSRDEKLK